jgi:hypothetical protein
VKPKFKTDDKVLVTNGPHKGKRGLIDGSASTGKQAGKFLVWLPTATSPSTRHWFSTDQIKKEGTL